MNEWPSGEFAGEDEYPGPQFPRHPRERTKATTKTHTHTLWAVGPGQAINKGKHSSGHQTAPASVELTVPGSRGRARDRLSFSLGPQNRTRAAHGGKYGCLTD